MHSLSQSSFGQLPELYYYSDNYRSYPIVFRSARGCQILDACGHEYLDLFACMGTVSCGHCNSAVTRRVGSQLDLLWSSSSFASEVQIEAIRRLNALLPKSLSVAAFYSTGSEAVELALRLARSHTGRRRIISFREHFHGKTHGAIYLLDPYPKSYGDSPLGYASVLDLPRTVATESSASCATHVLDALRHTGEDVPAAVICEPVVGANGPRCLPKGFLEGIRRFCDESGAVMIVDEILTGVYRCGSSFCCTHEGVIPDILCFGKGLGNGFPISGIAATSSCVADMKEAIPGSTFAGNPLACAAACGVLEYMSQAEEVQTSAQRMEVLFRGHFCARERPEFEALDLDGVGALLSIGFRDEARSVTGIYASLLRRGVIVSHNARRLRISPPLVITDDEFCRGLRIIGEAIRDELNGHPSQ